MLSPFFAWDLFDEPTERRPQWQMLNNFSPLVDIKETQQAITLRCEMPGIPPECVKVDFNDGCVIISGMKPSPQEECREFSQKGGKRQLQGREGYQSKNEPFQQQQQQQQREQQRQGSSGTVCPTSSATGLGRERMGESECKLHSGLTGTASTEPCTTSTEPCTTDTSGKSGGSVGSTGPGTGWQTDMTQREGLLGSSQYQQQQHQHQQQAGREQTGSTVTPTGTEAQSDMGSRFGQQQQQQQQAGREQTGSTGTEVQSDMGSRFGRSDEKVQWHRIESACGEFRRSFRLPRGVTSKNISANSKYGVLEVIVTKPNEMQKESGERINISAST